MSGPFGASQWMYATDSGFYPHEISHSIRFDDGSSEYLSRTPGSAGNRKTMTWSGWFKRSDLAGHQRFFGAGVDNYVSFTSTGKIEINLRSGGSTSNAFIVTNSLHRDVSAWYHIVVAIDTTQGTDTNRVKIYVNGVQQTSFTEDAYPSQNNDLNSFNNTVEQFIGRYSSGNYYDGYMAEVHFIDGLALAPASFGDTKNDIWIPKNTSGLTYGTQGFRLQFKQSGLSANASGLGADTSGNTNHLNSVNHAAHDRIPDSPTNNFATYNSQDNPEGATLTNGNLKCTSTDAAYEVVLGTMPFSSGKYYWEQNATSGNAVDSISVATTAIELDKRNNNTGASVHSVAYYAGAGGTGSIYWNDSGHQTGIAGFAAGDVMSVACDMDNKTIQFRKNNSLIYTASSDANGNITNTWNDMIPAWSIGSGASGKSSVVNFGQDSSFNGQETAQGNADENGIGDFYYAPPSGYLALCTANLPAPVATIDPAQGGSPQDYFNTSIFTGNGTNQDIDIGFVPNFVWTRQRTDASGGAWMDSVRGDDAYFQTTNGNAEGNFANITFTSTGYNVNGNSNLDNENAHNYAGWAWKAGTAFSNDASATSVGSIDSSGSVNTDVGFSIIKWTAVGSSATQTIAHGLGAVPKMIIMKNRERTVNWAVYHFDIGNSHGLELNTNAAGASDSGWWNNTHPTSTVFTTGNGNGYRTGGIAEDYIAYCFAEVDGYSKIGKYSGNSNADGPFIHTGFRPAWLMFKKDNSTDDWGIHDSKRVDYGTNSNPIDDYLKPNSTASEGDDGASVDFYSNGFKWRINSGMRNNNGDTYIYMAFAEQPFKYANAR